MNQLWIVSLVCLSLIACVHGATLTYTATHATSATNWADTLTLTKFDTSLGTLTSVEVTIGSSLTTQITVDNTGGVVEATGNARTGLYINFVTAGGNNPFPSESQTELEGIFYEAEVLTNTQSFTVAAGQTQQLAQVSRTVNFAADVTVVQAEAAAFFAEVSANGGGNLNVNVDAKAVTITTTTTGNAGTTQTTTAAATITIIYTYTAGVNGDPQIVGFQGQRYQIHGIPDEHFALISTPSYYVNSRFVYIANGVCNYNDTECFSHPGTYIDEIGVVCGSARLRLVAGSHEHGLKAYLNDEALPVGVTNKLSSNTIVRVLSNSRVRIIFPDTTLTVVNSDHFFNLGADFTDAKLYEAGHKLVTVTDKDPKQAAITLAKSYPEYNMHGLLGQTWRNIVWPHQRLYEGEPTDYQTNGLFGSEFVYSQYIQPTQSKAQ